MKTIGYRELGSEAMDFVDSVFRSYGEYKPTAWGFVVRDNELLVAERCKKDDPERKGQLVIPGGGLKDGEDYIAAARREVREETGINTPYPDIENGVVRIETELPVLHRKENIMALINPRGYDSNSIYIAYLDSGKKYDCRLVSLYPDDEKQRPFQADSDARNPAYMHFGEVAERLSEFTPACQIGVGMGLEHKGFKEFFDESHFMVDMEMR